ncbi:MAG: TIGR00730 family Rossman fold protein [Enterococcus sp.]
MRIAVYCGAHLGIDPAYEEAAEKLGRWIVEQDHDLIYGGGKLGLMGIVANRVLASGGTVTGVMPEFLAQPERVHTDLTRLISVKDLDERKKRIMENADVCIALPGGIGTLEEIIEAYSWARVGQNNRPCIFFDANDYYQLLRAFFDQMVTQKFLSEADRQLVLFSPSLTEIELFIQQYYAK